MKEQIEMLKYENRTLQEKQAPIQAEPLQSKSFSGSQTGKVFWESSLHSLKGYHTHDDVVSVDSGKSFKFQSDFAGPSHFNRTSQVETEVSSFNAENQMDIAKEKEDQCTTKGQIEEETKVVSVEDYFVKDAEAETSTKENAQEESQGQNDKDKGGHMSD